MGEPYNELWTDLEKNSWEIVSDRVRARLSCRSIPSTVYTGAAKHSIELRIDLDDDETFPGVTEQVLQMLQDEVARILYDNHLIPPGDRRG